MTPTVQRAKDRAARRLARATERAAKRLADEERRRARLKALSAQRAAQSARRVAAERREERAVERGGAPDGAVRRALRRLDRATRALSAEHVRVKGLLAPRCALERPVRRAYRAAGGVLSAAADYDGEPPHAWLMAVGATLEECRAARDTWLEVRGEAGHAWDVPAPSTIPDRETTRAEREAARERISPSPRED